MLTEEHNPIWSIVITHGEEDQEMDQANRRLTSELKRRLHGRDTGLTEKKIGAWIWPTNDEPGSNGVVIIDPQGTLKFINALSRDECFTSCEETFLLLLR